MKDLSFLVILILLSSLGIIFPHFFASLKPLIIPLLIVIMLSMGLTLTPEDFREIARKPLIVFYGAFLQYTVMPLTGYFLAKLFNLSPEFLVGVVLVGSAPGGTASNLITYLSKGDLSYSISMTTTSTLLSPIFTPLWTYVLAGKYVEVPFTSMFETTLKIVVVPVLLGMTLRYFLRHNINKVEKFLPFLAVFSISLIIAVIFALNSKLLKEISLLVLSVVLIHNVLGFALGYLFGTLAGLDTKKVKALSIEVGMQNSGLSTVLALKYFSKVSALPSAVFSLSQNLLGVLLSLFFRRV